MHFLGAVIGGNNTSEAETIIDPYSEYEEVEEYVLYTRHEFLQDSRRSDRELTEREHGNRSEDMAAIIKNAKKRLSLNDEDALKSYAEYCGYSLDEDGNVVSTANRDAFYDWYEFGGRWEEMVGGLQGITCSELTERYGNGDSEVRKLLDCNVSVVCDNDGYEGGVWFPAPKDALFERLGADSSARVWFVDFHE